MEKICITCNEKKSSDLYSNDKSRKDGKRPECKVCKSARDKKYRETNIEKVKKMNENYYLNNTEILKEKSKKWYQENLEQSKDVRAKYYQDNREKMDLAKQKWYEKNKEKMKIWTNTYFKNKYQNDQDYKIKTIMNKRIRDYIKSKNKPTLEFLGCSIKDFKKWIEYQFDENMNWDNMGSYWHFDHVKPCKSFNFSVESEILECYNWTNLRPLKASENISKGSKIDNNIINKHKILVENYII